MFGVCKLGKCHTDDNICKLELAVYSVWCWVSDSRLRGALLHVGQLAEPHETEEHMLSHKKTPTKLCNRYVLLKKSSKRALLCLTKHDEVEMIDVGSRNEITKTLISFIYLYIHPGFSDLYLTPRCVCLNCWQPDFNISLVFQCFAFFFFLFEAKKQGQTGTVWVTRVHHNHFVHLDFNAAEQGPFLFSSWSIPSARSCVPIRQCPTRWASWPFWTASTHTSSWPTTAPRESTAPRSSCGAS